MGFVSLALAVFALATVHRAPAANGGMVPARAWVPAAAALAALLVMLSLGRQTVVFGHDLGPGPVTRDLCDRVGAH